MLMLSPPVLWVTKSLFPVVGVSYVLPWNCVSLTCYVSNKVKSKISDPSQSFLKTTLIKTYFTYHKIQKFKVYSLVVFSIFTKLCNHHHNLILEHFQESKKSNPHPSPPAGLCWCLSTGRECVRRRAVRSLL